MEIAKPVIVAALTFLLILPISHHRWAEMQSAYEYSNVGEWRVDQGDTLWEIATFYSDNRHDTSRVIDIIKNMNEEDLTVLHIGQRVQVPLFDCMGTEKW